MARRYQIDELLLLRSSPLVTRPTNLPPVEEWMGPIPDPAAQRKTTNNHNETSSSRRPSLFEARHISRGSNSDDIVLGPPKTAFASARQPGKGSIDATERPTRQNDTDDSKNDRFNFREKFFKERDTVERDFDRRDGKMGAFNNRRGEKEDWNSGRPRRAFGPDEQDKKPRRNGEFDRWENRDPRDQNYERGQRDKDGRFFPRREIPPGRARHEVSWRDDNSHDTPEFEDEKTSVRNREWRRDKHGVDRDWTRGAKLEQDPEWLDATDKEESRRVHTQEDFERWKEKMRAGSSQVQVEEKKEAPVEPTPEPPQKPESRPTDGEIFSANGGAFQDMSMARFFGLLGDVKPAQEPSLPPPPPPPEPISKKEPTTGKPLSRFTSLFSPPPGSPAKESESPLSARSPTLPATTTDADQEGFQRILQMLGGGRSHNSTPHNDNAQINRPSSLVQMEQNRSAVSSPSREHIQRQEHMIMQEAVSRAAGPPIKENMHSQESQARDRENLLRLMQQVRVSPGSGQAQGPAPGLLKMPDGLPHPPGIGPAHKGPNFMDDPAIANMPRPDADQLRRRPTNGPPMGYFEDMPFPQGGGQVPITPGGSRAPQGQAPPGMGIQRPPGFEHMPPPGWAGPPPPPQQGGGPAPLAPPPGIPTPTAGVNPGYMSNMMPMHASMPPPNDRQPFPRGPGGGGSAAFHPPPGMMPPPGYMNGPPHAGFPPMPHNAEAIMGLAHGGQGLFDGPGPQGPPPSSRHLLDMFGQLGGDARGGIVGPRQFR